MKRPRGVLCLVLLTACGTSQSAPQAEPDAPPPPAPVESAGLEALSSRPLADGYAALGLTGVNKPNGLEYRLRQSVPASTPDFVPRALDGLELWIADPDREGGWLAFYRGPLELRPGAANAEFRAVLFGPEGERRWDLDLNRFLGRPDHLEIQDVRLHEGKLYFNEACQSYSREAGGECSSLIRIDPELGSVDWRTPSLVSNNIFILHDPYVIAGYGFTNEPDSLYLVAQATGEVAARHGLDSAHSYLEIVDGRLVVVTRNRVYSFRLPGSAGP